MSEVKHTSTPWQILDLEPKRKGVVHIGVSKNIDPVATLYRVNGLGDEAADNAEFIVRAVNSHDALVEALEAYIKAHNENSLSLTEMRIAQEVLKQAKGA